MSNRFINLTGKQFGRWSVFEKTGSTTNGTALWRCVCQCGSVRDVKSSRLLAGRSKSCGCLSKEVAKNQKTTHGMSRTALYKLWSSMKARCGNPRAMNYSMYGGRGITVCNRWKKFENFYADMHPRPVGTTLERMDNNKGYSPENCRWATPFDQGQNKRNNRLYEIHGSIYTLSDVSRKFRIPINTFRSRLVRGWKAQDAATLPIVARHRNNK